MYSVAVKRDFEALHFLIGGDWGEENRVHAHQYALELILSGEALDGHGFLVDIVEIERALDEIRAHYAGRVLNDLPEFEGLNPSIEHFARILGHALADRIGAQNVTRLTVKLWENDIAWSSYTLKR